jgi:hypothetical protein
MEEEGKASSAQARACTPVGGLIVVDEEIDSLVSVAQIWCEVGISAILGCEKRGSSGPWKEGRAK